jgi:hypothetical protein
MFRTPETVVPRAAVGAMVTLIVFVACGGMRTGAPNPSLFGSTALPYGSPVLDVTVESKRQPPNSPTRGS